MTKIRDVLHPPSPPSPPPDELRERILSHLRTATRNGDVTEASDLLVNKELGAGWVIEMMSILMKLHDLVKKGLVTKKTRGGKDYYWMADYESAG